MLVAPGISLPPQMHMTTTFLTLSWGIGLFFLAFSVPLIKREQPRKAGLLGQAVAITRWLH
jgi:hypothetical protein